MLVSCALASEAQSHIAMETIPDADALMTLPFLRLEDTRTRHAAGGNTASSVLRIFPLRPPHRSRRTTWAAGEALGHGHSARSAHHVDALCMDSRRSAHADLRAIFGGPHDLDR